MRRLMEMQGMHIICFFSSEYIPTWELDSDLELERQT